MRANRRINMNGRNRRPQSASAVRRAFREAYEPLEPRTMMSLLGITLPGNPQIQTGGSGSIAYTSSSKAYNITTTDLDFVDRNGNVDPITANPSHTGTVSILVNNNGTLLGGDGSSGQDISILGDVTVNGTTYNGTLLTGSVLQFGYAFNNAGAEGFGQFDFRFHATGGMLQSLYFPGEDIGMKISGYSTTTFGSNYTNGGATEDWGNYNCGIGVKGFVGPITPLISTQASETAGGVVGAAQLSDSVTVSSTVATTGTVAFTLTQPDGTTVPEGTVAINGNGTYAAPNPVLATEVGTYTWHASYTGTTLPTGTIDSDYGTNESVTTAKASPTISTQASITPGAVVGSSLTQDAATVSGGFGVSGGTVTFSLTAPDGSVTSYPAVPVTADGTYDSPAVPTNEVGTYTWAASYSGDALNNGAIDNGNNESVTTVKVSSSVVTQESATGNVVGSAVPNDTAVVSGSANLGGSILFTLTAPDGSTAYTQVVPVTGPGSYSTNNTTPATQVGTYTWLASYSGDGINTGSIDNGNNETITIVPASPTIATVADETAGGVVGASKLSDSALVSGGDNPTGSIAFTLTQPNGQTITVGSVPVSGDGTYAAPTFVATQVGTYTWHASYSGDSLNNGAVDDGTTESVTTTAASPTLTTQASQSNGGVAGSAYISDQAVLAGSYMGTGTISFSVTEPDGTTVPEGSVTVNGDGAYNAPNPVLASAYGTYVWHASYSGDGLNNGAIDDQLNESVTIAPATPAVSTQASASNGGVVGSAGLTDSATVTGGSQPTGTITFTLYDPNNVVAANETVNVSGDGTYSTPTAVTATLVGTYTWTASYGGDLANSGASDDGSNESVTTSQATPTIVTNAAETAGGVVGTTVLSDSATVSGGYNPTGTVTFNLYSNPTGTGTPLFTDANEPLVNGVATSQGYAAVATGTDYWVATYNGDTNNVSVQSGVTDEPANVNSATPAITTRQQPASATVGTPIADQATVTGGYNPTGTVTFVLYDNANGTGTPLYTDANEPLVNGVANSKGYTATATGTDYWVATYNGDSNNHAVTSGTALEPVSVTPATPSITTQQQPANAVVGSSIADRATVTGLVDPLPGDTVTFSLYSSSTVQNSSTLLFTDANEPLTNGVATSSGYTAVATGTDYWVATFNGDSNNSAVTSGAALEPVVLSPASPAINTTQQPASAVVGSSIADRATVTGGFNPTGTVTFTLYSNPSGTGTPLYTDANEPLVNGVATSQGYIATATGTDYWVATYNGDSNNAAVSSGVADEPVTVTPASPAISTQQQPPSAVVGSSIADQATVTGGFNPTGTVTFKLYSNPTGTGTPLFIDANESLVNGVATSKGYTATATGTDYWVATYNGDSNNSAVTSGTALEPVTVTPATPAINTTQQPATAVVGSLIADQATVSGGYSPTGTVTFSLYNNPNGTGPALYTDANEPLVGGVATSKGYIATATGTDYWVATYNGDSNNSAVTSGAALEPVSVTPASPTVSTIASGSNADVVGAANLSDSATVSGGYNPTGSITFTLTGPGGTVVSSQTVTVSGDGNYAVPNPVLATQVGTYTWTASYGGDLANSAAHDQGGSAEQVTTVKASPSISTQANETAGGMCGSSSLSDSATVVGGDSPTGTITFTLTQPDGTTITVGTAKVTGDGTYASPSVTAMEVGTYTFHASYSGDSLNNGAVDNGANESLSTGKAGPTVTTTASETASGVVGSAYLSDSAVVAGGVNPTGSIVFTLVAPDGTPAGSETVTINGDGTYTTPTAVLATQVGTYVWHAAYSGDGLNSSAKDQGGAAEQLTTTKATPTISTQASETAGGMCGSAYLTDSATISGGYNPTGTITFAVTQPDGTTVTVGTATVNGDGTYTSPNVAANEVGTYTFHASYGGNSLNNGAVDNGQNESLTTGKAGPSITTQASESGNVVGSATLSDSAVLSGGVHPTGTITFVLKAPNGSTASTQSVTVNGDGTYAVPAAVLATQVGTYTWVATYSGDSLNGSATDPGGAAEQECTVKASPKVVTTATVGGNGMCGSATTNDSAVLSGGYDETGSITFVLTGPGGNTVSTQTVTVNGNGTYNTSSVLPTAAGTYTWTATYNGDTLNNSAKDQGGAAEQITIGSPTGTISGTKFQDLTGNGFSPDDTPLGGVTINLYKDVNGNGVYDSGIDTLVAKTVTASNGTYSFTNVQPGKYIVLETVPSGWVETGTPLTYSVTVTAGSSTTGINFDDYQEECNLTKFSSIYYVINGCQVVTELSGNVQPGDEVTAYATVAANYSDEVSLVSYTAPDNAWNANDASEQVIYDSKTVTISASSCAQTICVGPVQVPSCNFQLDFVCGPVINTFGNGNSNAQYHPQNRIFDSANGGSSPQVNTGSSISGIVFCDQNLDGTLDNCEPTISGATVSLENTAGTLLQTTTTGSNGSYFFNSLPAGTYLVVVSAPNGDQAESTNTITVTLPNQQNGQTNPMGDDADLNFAELCHCSAIQGCCWDDCNNDGKVDWNECGIVNVVINLSGYDCLGNKVTLSCKTDDTGCYSFTGLLPGCYTITEGQPSGFTQGTNSCGTVNGNTCGSKSGTDTFCNVQISNCGDAGINYNFGEHCTSALSRGASASTAFWQASNGQSLLKQLNGSPNSYALGTWLATMFPNTYSHVLVSGKYVSFANMTNAQIASFYNTVDYSQNTARLNTQVLAAAFNCYVTSTTLAGGNYAASFGFATSANGTGYDVINIGSNGAAFGVTNNSSISILQALNATDEDASSNGVLYATSEVVNGTYYSASTLQSMALTVYTNINNAGAIT